MPPLLFYLILVSVVWFIPRLWAPWEYFRTIPPENIPISVGILDMPRASPSWATDSIPKIVHQTAPADQSRWHPIWRECQDTWFKYFPSPEYKYVMWTDQDIDAFVSTRYPKLYPAFLKLPKNIQRIDLVRYLILYEYGGIYADMDYECVRNFYDQLPNGKVSVAESMHGSERFQNALMASPARHPFWHYVLYECLLWKEVDDILLSTGPQSIVRTVDACAPGMFHPLPMQQYSYVEDKSVSLSQRTTLSLSPNQASDIWAPQHTVYARHHGSTHYLSEHTPGA